MPKRGWWVVVAAVVALLVGGGIWAAAHFGLILTHPSTANAPHRDVPAGSVSVVAKNLRAPWGLAFLPDGTALVTERDNARIVSVAKDGTVAEVRKIDEARPAGEGGLLGIAVGPNYATDRWVYVYYTAAEDNRIARLRLDAPGEAPQVIFSGIPKAGNHNGGRIAFGPDGMLYVGTGDAAERSRSQDVGSLGGKILRLTPDGKPAAGNPFGDSPVWTLGHRNVQGLAWDARGRMYASEFGQNRYDELNIIEPGKNYGWPDVEGTGDDSRFVNPIATFATSDASPSGIAVAGGHVYMACLRGQRLYRLGPDGEDAEALFVDEYGRLRNATLAPDGSLWILTSNHDGRGDPVADDDRIIRLTV